MLYDLLTCCRHHSERVSTIQVQAIACGVTVAFELVRGQQQLTHVLISHVEALCGAIRNTSEVANMTMVPALHVMQPPRPPTLALSPPSATHTP